MTQLVLALSNWFQFSDIASKINRLFTNLEDYSLAYRTRRELYKLSDRELEDIGITRGDIISISNGTLLRDK